MLAHDSITNTPADEEACLAQAGSSSGTNAAAANGDGECEPAPDPPAISGRAGAGWLAIAAVLTTDMLGELMMMRVALVEPTVYYDLSTSAGRFGL